MQRRPSKKTYIYAKKPIKRDLHICKEAHQKRPTYMQRSLSKETYIYAKKPIKRDLHICKEADHRGRHNYAKEKNHAYERHDFLICDTTHFSMICAEKNSHAKMCYHSSRYVATRCSVLQCIAVRCSALQCAAVRCIVCCSVMQCVLQCVAVCYSSTKSTIACKDDPQAE